jgi:hypothetical protein
LYEKDKLSLGRVWSWIAFYVAIMYWVKFEVGIIPPTTPFPPVLENFLYVCLLYEFGKKSTVMAGGITGMMLDKKQGKNRGMQGANFSDDLTAPKLGRGGDF